MNFERKWCHECSGIQLFGEHKGKACCSAMSRILTKAQAAGLIRNAGKRDCSVTGRSAIAWKAEKEVFHGNKPNHKGNPAGEL